MTKKGNDPKYPADGCTSLHTGARDKIVQPQTPNLSDFCNLTWPARNDYRPMLLDARDQGQGTPHRTGPPRRQTHPAMRFRYSARIAGPRMIFGNRLFFTTCSRPGTGTWPHSYDGWQSAPGTRRKCPISNRPSNGLPAGTTSNVSAPKSHSRGPKIGHSSETQIEGLDQICIPRLPRPAHQ